MCAVQNIVWPPIFFDRCINVKPFYVDASDSRDIDHFIQHDWFYVSAIKFVSS